MVAGSQEQAQFAAAINGSVQKVLQVSALHRMCKQRSYRYCCDHATDVHAASEMNRTACQQSSMTQHTLATCMHAWITAVPIKQT